MEHKNGEFRDDASPQTGQTSWADRIEQKIDLLLESIAALRNLAPLPPERQPVTDAGITVAEAARRLGCSPSKAYRLYGNGELTGHSVGDKIVIDPASVEAYKQRHANKTNVQKKPAGPLPRGGRRFRHLDL